jgi:hypothetical protein
LRTYDVSDKKGIDPKLYSLIQPKVYQQRVVDVAIVACG